MFSTPMLENIDYWCVEEFDVYKIRVISSDYNFENGLIELKFMKYIDRFDLSPLILTKSMSAEVLPYVLHDTKDEAMIIFTKLLTKLDFETQDDDTLWCDDEDLFFDKHTLEMFVKDITEEFPERFV